LTAGGSNLEAILNVHPFHTVRFEGAKDLMSEFKLSSSRATDFIDGLAEALCVHCCSSRLIGCTASSYQTRS
jgi:hypothetical protein